MHRLLRRLAICVWVATLALSGTGSLLAAPGDTLRVVGERVNLRAGPSDNATEDVEESPEQRSGARRAAGAGRQALYYHRRCRGRTVSADLLRRLMRFFLVGDEMRDGRARVRPARCPVTRFTLNEPGRRPYRVGLRATYSRPQPSRL